MKAIIPAAGKGTRFLPVTKAVPKEMLPIGAKPAIQLIAEEAVVAGADEIVFVISPEKELVRRYFETEKTGARMTWVYQTEQKGLGHAVLQAAEACADADRVLVLLGDALVTGGNASEAMAAASAAHGGASVIGLERVPREKVSRYGIVKPVAERSGDGVFRIADLVEKPSPETAPSDFAIAGRYLLDTAIFRFLKDQTAGYGGEIQLTDAIRRMAAEKELYGYVYPGKRQDIGNPKGYLQALMQFAGQEEVER